MIYLFLDIIALIICSTYFSILLHIAVRAVTSLYYNYVCVFVLSLHMMKNSRAKFCFIHLSISSAWYIVESHYMLAK